MNTAVGFFTLRLKLGCILYCPYKKEIKFYISREIKKTAKEEEQQRCISKWHDSWNPVICSGSLETGKHLHMEVAKDRVIPKTPKVPPPPKAKASIPKTKGPPVIPKAKAKLPAPKPSKAAAGPKPPSYPPGARPAEPAHPPRAPSTPSTPMQVKNKLVSGSMELRGTSCHVVTSNKKFTSATTRPRRP